MEIFKEILKELKKQIINNLQKKQKNMWYNGIVRKSWEKA